MTFLWLGWRERKKGTESAHKHRFVKLFLHAFSYRFRVSSVRLGARRCKSTTSKTAQNHWFLWWNLRMRHLRAQRDNLPNRTKVEQNNSQHASQNRPRRPGRVSGPPPARNFHQKPFNCGSCRTKCAQTRRRKHNENVYQILTKSHVQARRVSPNPHA